MPLRLSLGVVEVPYDDEHGTTTGEVAQFLEDTYHPIETFYGLRQQKIADDIANGLSGALETMLMGGPSTSIEKAAEQALGGTEADFRQFLSTGEMERMGIPGVPTQAALKGVNHRLKHPYSEKNRRRPSFVDTGLYQSSFRAWITRNG